MDSMCVSVFATADFQVRCGCVFDKISDVLALAMPEKAFRQTLRFVLLIVVHEQASYRAAFFEITSQTLAC